MSEYRHPIETDDIFGEQLALSARVVAERATLPKELVEYHEAVLAYWGVTLQGLGQMELPFVIGQADDDAFYADAYKNGH